MQPENSNVLFDLFTYKSKEQREMVKKLDLQIIFKNMELLNTSTNKYLKPKYPMGILNGSRTAYNAYTSISGGLHSECFFNFVWISKVGFLQTNASLLATSPLF